MRAHIRHKLGHCLPSRAPQTLSYTPFGWSANDFKQSGMGSLDKETISVLLQKGPQCPPPPSPTTNRYSPPESEWLKFSWFMGTRTFFKKLTPKLSKMVFCRCIPDVGGQKLQVCGHCLAHLHLMRHFSLVLHLSVQNFSLPTLSAHCVRTSSPKEEDFVSWLSAITFLRHFDYLLNNFLNPW